jgi:hypothetical protein
MALKFCLQDETPPLIEGMEYDRDQPAPSGYVWMSRYVRNTKEILRKEPLFLIPIMKHIDTSPVTEGHIALSRDWKYYYSSQYIASTEERNAICYKPTTLFWTPRQPPVRLPFSSIFVAVFSPNSQLLCGFTVDRTLERTIYGSFYVVECATRKARRLFPVPKGFSEQLGWYPDNLHFWYTCETAGRQKMQVFKCNVLTGKRILLRGELRKQPFQDWDLLDPSYRYTSMTNSQAFAYARNHQVRVRVEPIRGWSDAKPGMAQVYVEWRNGQLQQLIRKGEHQWILIHPKDVSEDGQWVLLLCQNLIKDAEGRELISSDLVAWNTQTKRHYVYSEAAASWQFVR